MSERCVDKGALYNKCLARAINQGTASGNFAELVEQKSVADNDAMMPCVELEPMQVPVRTCPCVMLPHNLSSQCILLQLLL